MNSVKALVAGCFTGALMTLGSAASAASVTPNFDTFGNLTTLSGGVVDFGGSGIPTDPAAVTNFEVANGTGGTDNVRVGIIATPRFGSPTPSNDGAGTYTVMAGESATGLSLWNFSFYAETSGNSLSGLGLKLYYDLDPTVGNDLSTMGVFDVTALIAGLLVQDNGVFEGSQNLGFGFLSLGGATFDPFATGEYSFRIGVDDGDFAAINVNVAPVPVPAGLPLLLTALGGFYWLRRKTS